MLRFLGDILDQLDLAAEHLSANDANNARFALMLTDNAIELTLHEIAAYKAGELKHYPHIAERFEHRAALEKALGRNFEPKVRFARLVGTLSDEAAQSIVILHRLRNEVYHLGVQHRPILQPLARFYFHVVCSVLATWRPPYFSWSSSQTLPERAKKYFKGHPSFPGEVKEFHSACTSFASSYSAVAKVLAGLLSDQMHDLVARADTSIDIMANDAPERRPRSEAVMICQAWDLAFSVEGQEYGDKHGVSRSPIFKFVDWLREHYPFRVVGDPIASWTARADALANDANAHHALKTYFDFLDETDGFRRALDDAAAAVERHIDEQIDRMRGK